MKDIQIHRSEGLRIEDRQSRENLYLKQLEQAAEDAEISLNWPEPSLVRIFPLADGRITVVRETANGLSQEAASPAVQVFYQSIVDKADLLIQKETERKASEASDEAPSDEV